MSMLDRLRGLTTRGTGPAVRDGMTFAALARLVTHLCDAWGEEAASEFSFDPKPPGFEPLIAFEFAPWGERSWWTYATAGLSLSPAMDEHPPTELVAYAQKRAEGLVDLLHQIAFKERSALAYREGDIVSFDADPPDLGVPLGRHFAFLPALETPALLGFPDVSLRPEDCRYTMARPREDDTRVRFLRIVALTDFDRDRIDAVRRTAAATRRWRLF